MCGKVSAAWYCCWLFIIIFDCDCTYGFFLVSSTFCCVWARCSISCARTHSRCANARVIAALVAVQQYSWLPVYVLDTFWLYAIKHTRTHEWNKPSVYAVDCIDRREPSQLISHLRSCMRIVCLCVLRMSVWVSPSIFVPYQSSHTSTYMCAFMRACICICIGGRPCTRLSFDQISSSLHTHSLWLPGCHVFFSLLLWIKWFAREKAATHRSLIYSTAKPIKI